ncbi:D-ribose pyranase [Aquibacillus sp. 3ASR75-11]|uniref:D-ribose pyranase n=1 Tax=Terrihalobacillus insolitus TaxID=2950438 RepID=A0A9X4AKX2_9BACI|nr:D-ribose pyranase [Terrihalobacillus insolitus]MDC3423279.1 D-ribose pyranase [Terrihalobacillus insolitus]
MKKSGMLNRDITTVLAKLGHTDTIIIADCGLPIPEETMCIDVSIALGTPSLTSVLRAIVDDMKIEEMTLANEIKEKNGMLHEELIDTYADIPKQYISHDALKQKTKQAKAVIRTGEATPYANVILQAGVIF